MDKAQVADGVVVTLEYTLRVDNEVVDSSEGHEPIQFVQGQGEVIQGLERALYGLTVGDSKQVVVPPEEGYGEYDPDAVGSLPRSDFPQDIPLEEGVTLNIRDEEGHSVDATIDRVESDAVWLNFNHPLAGEELHFDVKVVGVRPATEEEVAHGHVHGDGGHEH